MADTSWGKYLGVPSHVTLPFASCQCSTIIQNNPTKYISSNILPTLFQDENEDKDNEIKENEDKDNEIKENDERILCEYCKNISWSLPVNESFVSEEGTSDDDDSEEGISGDGVDSENDDGGPSHIDYTEDRTNI